MRFAPCRSFFVDNGPYPNIHRDIPPHLSHLCAVIDFHNISYLQHGSQRQREAHAVLTRHRIMDQLAGFTPVLAGTIPIDIAIESSDLDVICSWGDKKAFVDTLMRSFGEYPGFLPAETIIGGQETVLATCCIDGFEVEFFGQSIPVAQQNAYRHMVTEYYVLQQHGESFRREIIRLKQQGIKTEPAFALLLGLPVDDAYNALLHYTVS
jgi:hypothetical protein